MLFSKYRIKSLFLRKMQAQLLRIQVLILRAQQIDIAACVLLSRLFSATAGKRNLLGIQGQIFAKQVRVIGAACFSSAPVTPCVRSCSAICSYSFRSAA